MKKHTLSAILGFVLITAVLTAPVQAYSIDELTIKCEFTYKSIESPSEGYCIVRKDTDGDGYDEYGLIDSEGKEIVPPRYDYMSPVSEGAAKIGMDTDKNPNTGLRYSNGKGTDKYGFVTVTGKEIVAPVYDGAEDFSDGMAVVRRITDKYVLNGVSYTDSKLGFVDKTGKELIAPIYDKVSGRETFWAHVGPLGNAVRFKPGFSEGAASVCKDGHWGVIDKKGNVMIPFKYEALGSFSEGLARVKINNKYGFINKQGIIAISAQYDFANDFCDGFATVARNDSSSATGLRSGFIDRQGKLIAPMEYEVLAASFSEGLISVAAPVHNSAGEWVGWRYGYLDTNGTLVVPTIYYSAAPFSDGLAMVNIPEGWDGTAGSAGINRYGFIDKHGKVVVPLKYTSASMFSEGLAKVATGSGGSSKGGYIDTTGKEIIPLTSTQYGTSDFSNGIALAFDRRKQQTILIKNPLLIGQTDPTAPTESPAFPDVPVGEWYADPVTWAVKKNITNGTTATTFSPAQNCTHAQILTFLYRANRGGGAAVSGDMDKAVSWARGKGMVDSSFNGNRFCTRAEAVKYIWQAFNKPGARISSFNDVPANADYADAVSWAVEKGVTKGTNTEGTEFSPDTVCTRGHIVTFLYRAYNG